MFHFKELEKKFKEQCSSQKMLEIIITKAMYFFLFFFFFTDIHDLQGETGNQPLVLVVEDRNLVGGESNGGEFFQVGENKQIFGWQLGLSSSRQLGKPCIASSETQTRNLFF